jgi:2-polyprenyl-3-methyl-5-hydroxy-6-metoxy-1,4-benzoquinol methylase
MPEFDAFARNYPDLVTDSVRISGESSDYFAKYKASYMAREIGSAARILDYGCGVGLLASHLKRAFPESRVDGFDLSEESLQRVDPFLRAQGVFTADASELAHDYEVIVIANVLHHVRPAERQRLVQDVSERLVSGGKLVIFEHNPLNPLTRWAVSQCPFDEGVRLLSANEVRSLCSGQLCCPRTAYIVFFPRWLAWLRAFEPFLKWCAAGAQHATISCRAC